MQEQLEKRTTACWFVGAAFRGGTKDQTQRFLDDGVWENGYKDRYLDTVRSMQPGDRIAIKATYTRKHGLPFNNRGITVSVMAVKAIGTVVENLGDGRRIKVNWIKPSTQREWYFYTNRLTVWRVLPGNWYSDSLINFAFDGQSQDLDRYRNAPFWKERFGDTKDDKIRFQWTKFYEAVADKLLLFQKNRKDLVKGIHELSKRVDGLTNLQDQFSNGTSGPLKDICPFTVMGVINRGITDANRKSIAAELAKFLDVKEPVPDYFIGIPVLNNQRSWFFAYENKRQSDDIDKLWSVFSEAIRFADSEESDDRQEFADAYNVASNILGVGWNLTMGLYWIRPWFYPTLDSQSRHYITKKLGIKIGLNGSKGRCDANDYLKILDTLDARFNEDTYPVHSFPELSLASWYFSGGAVPPQDEGEKSTIEIEDESEIKPINGDAPIVPYSVENIISDGCFIEAEQIIKYLDRIRTKKNIILQGPPGTGKTWLAKRLAYAHIGEKNERRVRSVQFHPNLSYEDFVRGWRPTGEGKLSLVDGPFMEMVNASLKDHQVNYVIVIEEINRGNPAQIFGEMLTLLETDKRTPDESLELCYRREEGERVFIPSNLYVIGTMNTADRSLALVDFALRRRFAFIDLKPKFGSEWHSWVSGKFGIDDSFLSEIEKRILTLNEQIRSDSNLGPQFEIGHSYFTPSIGTQIPNPVEWFIDIVNTEIGPLLSEYWYDSKNTSIDARKQLINGL